MGAAQYKTAVERLYLCGPGTYPGGGVHGACGYNAYQVIAKDLDIEFSSATINAGVN
jgi:phytoene dehydrogenase-like protein